tara:strand:- start:959 stop:1231 length:273 start_codon:yes stop_codon:yes gene_type:complete
MSEKFVIKGTSAKHLAPYSKEHLQKKIEELREKNLIERDEKQYCISKCGRYFKQISTNNHGSQKAGRKKRRKTKRKTKRKKNKGKKTKRR